MFNPKEYGPTVPSEAHFAAIASIRDLGELNRVLFLISETGMEFEVLAASFRWESVKGYMHASEDALRLGEILGLVYAAGGKVHRTNFGTKFQSLNAQRTYELTDAQRDLLVKFLFYSPNPISTYVDEILLSFKYNTPRLRYEYSIPDYGPLPGKRELHFLLSALKVLRRTPEGTLFVSPDLSRELASKIRRWREQRVDQSVDAERLEISRHAEKLVLQYEQDRLRGIGRADLASLVEIVAEYDSTVGYDILSYDGKNSRPHEPDRYIEVKSTPSDRFHFFVTETELAVSRRYGLRYWIYHISRATLGCKFGDCIVRFIRNPAVAILDLERFEISAKNLHVIARAKGLGPDNT